MLVAEDDCVIIGFCAVRYPSRDDDAGPRTADVVARYVDPERWRQRIGEALLDGWEEASLWVLEENSRARSFYAKHGFAADGAVKRDADEEPVYRGWTVGSPAPGPARRRAPGV